MRKGMFLGGIVLSCILLSGCTAVTDWGKDYYFPFAWVADWFFGERQHEGRIIVKDADGNVLIEIQDQEAIEHFASAVEKLEEEDVLFSWGEKEELLYEYEVWDNDKKVSFFLYEPGDILSCGVGKLQVYFRLSEEVAEEFCRLLE